MFKKAILHLGLAKSGSTALQNFLFDNRGRLLARHDILYPGDEENHYHFPAFFSDRPQDLIQLNRLGIREERPAREFLGRYFARFEHERRTTRAKTLLLSSEYFSAMTAAELARLRSYLEQIAEELVLVAYVRDPWSFSISWLQQNLRDGSWHGSMRPGYYRGNVEILDTFAAVFGVKPRLRPYIAIEQVPFDVREDFARFLGIVPEADLLRMTPKAQNKAMGWKCACIVSHVNELFPSIDANGRYLKNARRDWVVEKILDNPIDDAPIRLSRRTARKIHLESDPDLARLRDEYLGGDDIFQRAYAEDRFSEHDDLISIDRLSRDDLVRALLQAQYAQADCGIKWMEEVAALMATKSWRLTTPLRAAYRLLRA